MNTAQQGRRLEYLVRDDLIANGYRVMRAAGSKGSIDLMAVKPGQVLFVQVKRTIAPGPTPWNLLFETATWAGAVPVLATCSPRKPIRYERMTALKDKPGRAPLEPFLIDLPASGESA